MTVEVAVVDGSVTAPLRRDVLRPHQTVEEMAVSLDEGSGGWVHVAARIEAEVVGAGLVRPEAPPWAPDLEGAWRLRGMATALGRRGLGIGAAVLGGLIEVARAGDGRTLWCSARIPALVFYERAGFRPIGDRWDEPGLGPHIHLTRAL